MRDGRSVGPVSSHWLPKKPVCSCHRSFQMWDFLRSQAAPPDWLGQRGKENIGRAKLQHRWNVSHAMCGELCSILWVCVSLLRAPCWEQMCLCPSLETVGKLNSNTNIYLNCQGRCCLRDGFERTFRQNAGEAFLDQCWFICIVWPANLKTIHKTTSELYWCPCIVVKTQWNGIRPVPHNGSPCRWGLSNICRLWL